MASPKAMWQFKEPQKSYDAVIIGGGLHGMAAAYYLARDHNINRVAVLERRYIGYGGSGRNTEIIRSNQRAPEILPLYVQSTELWNSLSAELEWNIMVWMKGLVGLAHNDAGFDAMRGRHETQIRMNSKNWCLPWISVIGWPTLSLAVTSIRQAARFGTTRPSGAWPKAATALVWTFAPGSR